MLLFVSAGPLLEVQGIRVLSYPQYCRFRSLQKRIQDAATSPEMQNPHVMALGGVKAPPTTRLMYCRDTFSHPMLENNSNFSWQFSECLLIGQLPQSCPSWRAFGHVLVGCLVSSCRMSVSQSQRSASEEERARWERVSHLQPVRGLDRQDEGQFTGTNF